MNALRAELKLLAVPTAVRCARDFTAQVLERWRLSDLVDTACLVVSELTTNAVRATGTLNPEPYDATLASLPLVELLLSIRSGVLLIEVGDTSTTPPELQQQYETAESGRGLLLVAMLSKEWSFYVPEQGGKVVWAAVELLGNEEQAFADEAAGPLPRRVPGASLTAMWHGAAPHRGTAASATGRYQIRRGDGGRSGVRAGVVAKRDLRAVLRFG